jgi:hypothetical protein
MSYRWKLVATNLAGVVETPAMPGSPYRIDEDGHPFVPIGDGGVVLGVRLGDGVFATDADHAAPGVCVVHSDPAARLALVSYACMGNPAIVRSGAAAGEAGVVLGKRGEAGRVIVTFPQEVLSQLRPADAIVIRGYGQSAMLPGPIGERVALRNVAPSALSLLDIDVSGSRVAVLVRGVVPSKVVGNGIGRPTEQWDLDLTINSETAPALGMANLALGDLVAVTDLDIRHNAGFRRGFVTVGIVVHGASPQPGHGPGLMPLMCGAGDAFDLRVNADHSGLSEAALLGFNEQ